MSLSPAKELPSSVEEKKDESLSDNNSENNIEEFSFHAGPVELIAIRPRGLQFKTKRNLQPKDMLEGLTPEEIRASKRDDRKANIREVGFWKKSPDYREFEESGELARREQALQAWKEGPLKEWETKRARWESLHAQWEKDVEVWGKNKEKFEDPKPIEPQKPKFPPRPKVYQNYGFPLSGIRKTKVNIGHYELDGDTIWFDSNPTLFQDYLLKSREDNKKIADKTVNILGVSGTILTPDGFMLTQLRSGEGNLTYGRTIGISSAGTVDAPVILKKSKEQNALDERGKLAVSIDNNYIEDQIADETEEEISLDKNKINILIVGFGKDHRKPHVEACAVILTTENADQIINRNENRRSQVVSDYAKEFGEEVIKIKSDKDSMIRLLTQAQCPIPYTHIAGFIATLHFIIVQEKMKDKTSYEEALLHANREIKKLEPLIADNQKMIDQIVKGSYRFSKLVREKIQAGLSEEDAIQKANREIIERELLEEKRKTATSDEEAKKQVAAEIKYMGPLLTQKYRYCPDFFSDAFQERYKDKEVIGYDPNFLPEQQGLPSAEYELIRLQLVPLDWAFEKAHVKRENNLTNQAREYYVSIRKEAEKTGDKRLVAQCNHMTGITHYQDGDYYQAEVYIEKAENEFEELGDKENLGAAKRDQALSVFQRNYESTTSYKKAENLLQESIAVLQNSEVLEKTPEQLGLTKSEVAFIEAHKGNVSLAEQTAHEAINLIEKNNTYQAKRFAAHAYYRLAQILQMSDQRTDARKAAHKAMQVLDTISPANQFLRDRKQIHELLTKLQTPLQSKETNSTNQ